MVKWEDNPSTNTPLNAANLNKMQTDLQYGTIIQKGQDLNDITEVGLYHSENGGITNTLIDCPIRDNGFRLEVITINIPNRLLQIINVNARDEIWIRRLNTLITNENNGEWVKLVNNTDIFSQIYGIGNVIKSGEDLNNFTKIGNYCSENASISASLKNCPISNTAFKLKVENIAREDRYIQTIMANNNEVRIYSRTFDSSQTWGDWVEISPNDTGWIDLPLTSAFKKTNMTSVNPVYRKVGKMVQITGAVTPTAEIVAGQITKIATLPTGFRPRSSIYTLCQGSLMNKWLLFIENSGNVYIERYGVSSNEKIPLNTWLPFNATFFVD